MRFFVPKADSDAEADEIWRAAREILRANGYKVTERRIYEIHYRHNGDDLIATVGGREPLTKGLVLAIFEAEPFLICTPKRGFLRGEGPVFAGIPDRVIEFESV